MATHPAKPAVRRGAKPKGPPRRGLWIFGVLIIILIIIGALPRIIRFIELSRIHNHLLTRVRRNEAIVATASGNTSTLVLPGDTQALQQISIMARADGYLSKRFVDIGDHVKKGQLLAIVATPELNQQTLQARADVRTQLANLNNAKATYVHYVAVWHASIATVQQSRANVLYDLREIKRYQFLAGQGAVSCETRDSFARQLSADQAALATNIENEHASKLQADAAYEEVAAAQQTVESYMHNAERLAELQGFQNIRAPFDGVITARYVDEGNLIQSGGAGTQILAMGSPYVLRVFVQVPQTVFRSIRPGDRADLLIPEFPHKTFPGVVTNVSGGLDPQSRTLQVEVRVNNRDETIPIGVYSEVSFIVPNTIKTTVIPVNAISARADGNFVVVVTNGRAHFRALNIFRDNGATVDTSAGVQPGETVLLDPPDDLKENEQVEPVFLKQSSTPS